MEVKFEKKSVVCLIPPNFYFGGKKKTGSLWKKMLYIKLSVNGKNSSTRLIVQ